MIAATLRAIRVFIGCLLMMNTDLMVNSERACHSLPTWGRSGRRTESRIIGRMADSFCWLQQSIHTRNLFHSLLSPVQETDGRPWSYYSSMRTHGSQAAL